MSAKTKSNKAKSPKALDVAKIVDAAAARLPSRNPTLGSMQELFTMLRADFGHPVSAESATSYTDKGAPIVVEKSWLWNLPGNQSLTMHYGPAGIQVLHGFAENPDTNAVLLHLTKTPKKKVDPRLMTSERFTAILNGAMDSEYALLPTPEEQHRLLEDLLVFLLGKPVGDGGSSCGTEYVEWAVGNAELTFTKDSRGSFKLKLRDLT